MTRPLLLALLAVPAGLLLACASPGGDPAERSSERANVLFLLADDMQWNAIAALGNEEIHTPNLDRLVANGVAFTTCVHQGSPHGAVCMPSRAMIWTGRDLWRRGGDQCGDHPLFGQTLREAGYATFATGKWHNGPDALARSFEHVGRTGGGMLHSTPNGGDAYWREELDDPWQPDDPTLSGHWMEHEGRIRHSSEVWADEAIGFLEAREAGDDPFFVHVAFHAPHDPRQAPSEYVDLYDPAALSLPVNYLPEHPFDNGALRLRDEQLAPFPRTPDAVRMHLAEYYAVISHMDAQIGRVLDALEATGEAEDTIVVFAADHGLAMGQHGLLGKQSLYDHSLRAPLIFAGPGVPRGELREGLVYLHSIFPTVCELVGVAAPSSVDAASLAGMISDPDVRVHETTYTAYGNVQRAVRDEGTKLVVYPDVREVQMFDLSADPHELENLAGRPESEPEVRRLAAELGAWMERTEDGLDPALVAEPWTWNATDLSPETPAPRPNIVVILADDLGYGDVRALNPASRIPTPNLDGLASSGMTFVDAHSPSAVCTPTRYGLVTGRYCWRSSLKSGVLVGTSPALIDPERETVATMLSAAGYRTACIGKWHLGLDYTKDADGENDYAGPIGGGPRDLGFHEFFGIPASLDFPPYAFVDGRSMPSPPTVDQPGGGFPGFIRAGLRSPDFDPVACLDQLTDRACAFIEQNPAHLPPFFLYFPLTAPHKPVSPAPRFQGATELGPYGDFVVAVDATVGRVLESLEAAGVADETIVLFTSDNGSFMYRRAEDAVDHTDDETNQGYRASTHRSNGPFRGTKADIWEAGHHVPFLARWPEGIAPGTTCDETICHVDFFATLAALAGRPLADDAAEDSFDLTPLFAGEELATPRAPVIHHSGSGMFAIRSGRWKLIAGNGSGGREQPKGQPFGRPFQLYDLESDPAETTDVLAAHPEIAAELEAALEALRNDGRSRP